MSAGASDPGDYHRSVRQQPYGRAAAVLLMLVCAVPGCSSGPNQPVYAVPVAEGTPTATIRNTAGWAFQIYVTAIDGKPVKYKRSGLGHDRGAPVKVPAGYHEVHVTINGGNIVYNWWFPYQFEAGHTYRVDHAGAFDQRVRVRDLTTGKSQVMKGPTKL